jgi:large subunit ribosomal protein L20
MRVKHSPASRKRKKKILKLTKGYWGKRKNIYRRAVETLRRALVYAYRDRKVKITRINAAVRERGLTYREFIHLLKEKNILLSRDMLAKIASEYPKVFDKIVEEVKK